MFDLADTGVTSVELNGYIGDKDVIKNLSSNRWIYKVGLHGEERKLFRVESPYASRWFTDNLPINETFFWYKTTFKPPLGTNPVVVDLQGLGKGHAWINGNSIGRYWPSFMADETGFEATCDYRGPYNNTKCVSNCGQPSQRWYHAPRSFLRDDSNTLILFEEIGGNPSLVNFQTIIVGSVCANAYEGNTLELSCHGRNISTVMFTNFGDFVGACGSFLMGSCESDNAFSIVQQACLGKESCLIEVSEATLGPSNCNVTRNLVNRLVVELACEDN